MITGVHTTPSSRYLFFPFCSQAQACMAMHKLYQHPRRTLTHGAPAQRLHVQHRPAIMVLFVDSRPRTQIHSFCTHSQGYTQAQTHLCMSKDHPCMWTPVERVERCVQPALPPSPLALCSGALCWRTRELPPDCGRCPELSWSLVGGREEGPPHSKLHLATSTWSTHVAFCSFHSSAEGESPHE